MRQSVTFLPSSEYLWFFPLLTHSEVMANEARSPRQSHTAFCDTRGDLPSSYTGTDRRLARLGVHGGFCSVCI